MVQEPKIPSAAPERQVVSFTIDSNLLSSYYQAKLGTTLANASGGGGQATVGGKPKYAPTAPWATNSTALRADALVKQAEALSSSTDWGPTAGAYRDLMQQWKAAGPAPRSDDEELWQRFRGAQDAFFNARDAVNKATDAEYAGNAEVKEKLLVEAEALLPVTDLDAAKTAFRDIADRWDAAGKVPRDRIKDLEGRMRAVEQTIRRAEDDQWAKSDPEKSARADDMVSKLESAIAEAEAKLAAARERGDDKRVRDLESSLEGQRSLLDMAKKVSADFS